jgi:hypothetical protein
MVANTIVAIVPNFVRTSNNNNNKNDLIVFYTGSISPEVF